MAQPKITADQLNANDIQITGTLNIGPTEAEVTDVVDLIVEAGPAGLIKGGGEVTRGVNPLDVNITAGSGYVSVHEPNSAMRLISWGNTVFTLPDDTNSFIYVNNDGIISSSPSVPAAIENVILARARTASGVIAFISNIALEIHHPVTKIDTYLRDVMGPIFGVGAIVTENVTPLHIDVTAGTYHYAQRVLNLVGGTNISIPTFYNTAGVWTRTVPNAAVSNTQYNNTATGLVSLTAGYYTKHLIYAGGEGIEETYGMVYGQDEHATLLAAQSAPLAFPPPYFTDVIVPIAAVIVQEGNPNIVQIIDIRPKVGFQSPSTTGSAVHGDLLGLMADNHPQYIRTDGTRAYTGNQSLGNNNLTDVGTINRVTITAPAAGSTLTIANGKTLTSSNTLTLTGTDGSSVAFGTGGTVVYTSNNLSVHASTTSAQLASVISDETGTGSLVFANTPTLITPNIGAATGTSLVVSGDLTTTAGTVVVPKTTTGGIKVDTVTPTYPWHDILGIVTPRANPPGVASLEIFRGGNVREWSFDAGDVTDNRFHIPHDYVMGSDLFLHIHWGHNGTAISGNIVFTISFTYAKGHNQATFPAETTTTITYNTVNIATTPQYVHRIDEVQITAASPNANQISSSLIEPDGIILATMTVTTIPTITGGSPNTPFVFFVDVHYQSTNIGTKQKSPNFYI